jgi:ornithine cyclodeaminase/alanine dehydrogenase-like protein (mu-crystallin family)
LLAAQRLAPNTRKPGACTHAWCSAPCPTHEAGDLLQAGLDVSRFASLADVIRQDIPKPTGPVLFKSCGWAGWDLAPARTALAR